ncbi:hypothetical protein I4U23_007638 [Adineta vaga]|nr:hypothetical protein I4U23_007638 [Adineta vaga]
MATSFTSAKFQILKKNKTGVFAANSIHEPRSISNHHTTGLDLPNQIRHNSVASFFYPPLDSKQHHLSEQYYSMPDKNDNSNDSYLTLNNRRNGFPPSNIRHQKMRSMTSSPLCQRTCHHPSETKDSSTKSSIMQSHASARLKSEIEYLQHKLKRQEEMSKSIRRDLNSTSHATLSYSTSCRRPSASTILTADRIHKRFSSAATHQTTNTLITMPTINDASTQTIPIYSNYISSIVPPITETDNDQHIPTTTTTTTEYRPTYAYQIPQQSNVGSESIFLTNSSLKTRSMKVNRQHQDLKSLSCPFYVMYLTNLTTQQNQIKDDITHNNDHEIIHKVPVNSRTTTVNLQHQSTRRQVNSRLSLDTYITIADNDDDICTTKSTMPSRHIRFSTADNEKSSKLRDILRTSSWNRVKV